MLWKYAETAVEAKPRDVERNYGKVYVRKNIKRIEATAEHDAKWVYDEACMSEEAYEVYQETERKTAECEDALVELASIIAEMEV